MFVVLLGGLLASVSCLPTGFLHNISLTYDGSQLTNLNTVDNLSGVDPQMTGSLKSAIMTALPDYIAFLNGNAATTPMSPDTNAFFNQPNLVNFHVDINTLPPTVSGVSFSPDGTAAEVDSEPVNGQGTVPQGMPTTTSSIPSESVPVPTLPGSGNLPESTLPGFLGTTLVPGTVTSPTVLPPAVLNSTDLSGSVGPPVDGSLGTTIEPLPSSSVVDVTGTTLSPLPSPLEPLGTTLPVVTMAPLGVPTSTVALPPAERETTLMPSVGQTTMTSRNTVNSGQS